MSKFFTVKNLEKFYSAINRVANTTTLANRNHADIVMRHDIDFSIHAAYKMAQIEKKCGITSTYFVMLSSSNYNVLAEENYRFINKISELGFEVGLHFYPDIYKRFSNVEDIFKEEISILEWVLDTDVKSYSLHHQDNLIFNGFNSAHEKEIFSNDVYLSDSSKNFRDKDPYKFINKAKQILLHPYYYTGA